MDRWTDGWVNGWQQSGLQLVNDEMGISKEGESVLIIVMTVRDWVRRELEGWRVGEAGRRGYSGVRRGCRGR